MIHSLELDASPPMQNQGSIGKEKELMALREAITSFTTLTLSSASLTLECHFLTSSTPAQISPSMLNGLSVPQIYQFLS